METCRSLCSKPERTKAKGRRQSFEYYKTIDTLQHKQNEAGTKLHELKNAGDDAWEELKNRRRKGMG